MTRCSPVSDQVPWGSSRWRSRRWWWRRSSRAAAVATQVAAAVVPVAAVISGGGWQVRGGPGAPGEPSVDAAVVAPAVAQRVAANQSGRSVKSLTTWRHPPLVAPRFPWATGNQSLPRGASLTDFADKIGANPASLVSVLFKLGEMVTATESVNDDTLALLGAELNYEVNVVSPEDEDRELLETFNL